MGKKITSNIDNKPLGFTIVELLIVIVIIGILAAITIVSYIGISKKATEASLTSDLDGAKRQLELYKTEHETYPTTMDANKCPTTPTNDVKYCLKNKDLIYTTTDNGITYNLKLTKSDITFEVTNDSTPKLAEAAPAEPTLPESDWITIGTQRWARKNLNVGTRIDSTADSMNNAVLEKYCYFNNESYCESGGALYQWDEAMDYSTTEGSRGICPAGSHIPTDNEWKILEISLGMNPGTANLDNDRGTNEGAKLKVGGDSGLNIPLIGGRNDDNDSGSFFYGDQMAILWSSSEDDYKSDAWVRRLLSWNSLVGRFTPNKRLGVSVRCLGN